MALNCNQGVKILLLDAGSSVRNRARGRAVYTVAVAGGGSFTVGVLLRGLATYLGPGSWLAVLATHRVLVAVEKEKRDFMQGATNPLARGKITREQAQCFTKCFP